MNHIALIDNYDSFTYNLVQLVEQAGARVTVLRNDRFALPDLSVYDKLLLSPGPGIPSEAGLLLPVIKAYASSKPILGVCLGEQAIGEAFGAKLCNLSDVFHGVQTEISLPSPQRPELADDYLFDGLPPRMAVGRYHSWVVSRDGLPDTLAVTAVSDEGLIMGLRHRTLDVHGIQFHPESVLTPLGERIIRNWIGPAPQTFKTNVQ